MADVLGTFEQAVLLALVRPKEGEEPYGRSILKDVQTRLKREVAAGAVYATLDRLEEKGLISSHVGEGSEARGGRQKRFYAIEPAGLRSLNEAKEAVENLWAGVKWPLKEPLKGTV
jgi:DNA-binding PadR family transcriptional regulator